MEGRRDPAKANLRSSQRKGGKLSLTPRKDVSRRMGQATLPNVAERSRNMLTESGQWIRQNYD